MGGLRLILMGLVPIDVLDLGVFSLFGGWGTWCFCFKYEFCKFSCQQKLLPLLRLCVQLGSQTGNIYGLKLILCWLFFIFSSRLLMRSLGSLSWIGRIVYGDFVECNLYVHIFIEKKIRLLTLQLHLEQIIMLIVDGLRFQFTGKCHNHACQIFIHMQKGGCIKCM